MDHIYRVQLNPSTQHYIEEQRWPIQLYETRNLSEYFVSSYSLGQLEAHGIPFELLRSYSLKEVPIKIAYPSNSYLFEPPSNDAVQEVVALAMSKWRGGGPMQILYLGRKKNPQEPSFILDRAGGKRSYHWQINETPRVIADIRDMFPKISKKIKDKQTKVILSLGSGGIRLFAHPSLMKFIDLLNLRPYIGEIWGSSGGAIAGLPYSLGISPSTLEQEGYNLYNQRYSFRLSPTPLEVVKNLLTDRFLPNSDFMLRGFMDCQKALSELIGKYVDKRKLDIPFYCVAYNLRERRSEVLTPCSVKSDDYYIPIVHTDALEAVIASSAIPILYVPKRILRKGQEDLYIDGGTTEEVPLTSPYHKWLQDRYHKREKRKKMLIIAVNLFPQMGSTGMFTHWTFQKIPAFKLLRFSASYADMIRQARIEDHKSQLTRDPNVTCWELTLPFPGSGIVNTKIIPEIIETAQKSFFEQLLKIERSL